MSDQPGGPGWWMADDLKWYPPSAVPGGVDVTDASATGVAALPAETDRRASRTRWRRSALISVGIVLLLSAVAGAWLLGRISDPAGDPSTAGPASGDTAVSTADTTTPPANPPSTGPAGPAPSEPTVDLSSPLVAGYSAIVAVADADPGTRSMLPDHLQTLTAATDVAWTETMLFALAASYCNDWDTSEEADDEGVISEVGESDWVAAVAPVIGISVENARIAIQSGIWRGYQFACE